MTPKIPVPTCALNHRGLIWWVMVTSVDAPVLLLPSLVIERSDSGMAVATGLGIVIVWALSALLLAMVRRCPGQSFVDAARWAFGRWAGGAVALTLAAAGVLYMGYTSAIVFHLVEAMLLPKTPRLVLGAYWIGFSSYLAFLGPDAGGRLASLVAVPTVVLSFFLGAGALTLPHEWNHLLPLFGNSMSSLLQGALVAAPFLLKAFLPICAGLPYLQPTTKWQVMVIWGFAGSLALQMVQAVLALAVLGPVGTAVATWPALDIIQLYSSGFYLVRFDYLLVIISLALSSTSVGLSHLFLAEIVARVFQVSRTWPVILIAGVAMGMCLWGQRLVLRELETPPFSIEMAALGFGVFILGVAALGAFRARRRSA
ncbi:GerAB/ArcD/ProY family transporter [Kyrpidia sp.]|uniref:GerAB/ArcD/ProY family transporter n=1 Tax=Kyrpidia sp. TaxID=2073077 RepID=UPI00258A20F8|nr:GerAB/ArcD/ProY family transporter [Kyrpidia sp.]MCL6575294.1 GerAB/ArcD/ProY family transporter [Kyrpidia sp.]